MKRFCVPQLRRLLLSSLSLAVLICAVIATDAQGQKSEPLLMDGKETLFQRILTRPGAQLVEQPGTAKGTPQPAFSRFYVYERKELQGKEWLLVGSDSHGKSDGWINSERTLPWKQQIALAFTNPANRDRTLLFKDRDTVMKILQSQAPGAAVAPILESVVAGKDDPRVVSIQPKDHVDISKEFYLLPILEAEEVATKRGYVRVLEVASVTKEGEAKKDPKKEEETPKKGAGQGESKRISVLRSFSAAGALSKDEVICYCGGGIAASNTAFLLARLGVDNVSLYDGSLTEWSSDPTLPMETG